MRRLYELHTHTTMSDGEMLPSEIIHRLAVLGYSTVAITDHADATNLQDLLDALQRLIPLAQDYGVTLLSGVELTHIPPSLIPAIAREAKELGAQVVVVHGETPMEPVAPGTNHAACGCDDVDVLAHPGLITAEDASLACSHQVALEVTSRGGHNRANGHVVRTALAEECQIVIDSDAHAPGDLLDMRAKMVVGMGAGIDKENCSRILSLNIEEWLLRRK